MYPKKESTPEEQQVANEIENYVNRYGLRPDGLITALSRMHRTLQQHMTRICRAWFEYLAALEPGEYDARNEGSVMMAKAIVQTDAWKKSGLPYV